MLLHYVLRKRTDLMFIKEYNNTSFSFRELDTIIDSCNFIYSVFKIVRGLQDFRSVRSLSFLY